MRNVTRLFVLLVAVAPASVAHAWDGPGLWHTPSDAASPGGGGIFGTGSARDYRITCEKCHMNQPVGQTIDTAVTFTPPLGAGGTYTPGQSYQVRIDLLGEFRGLSGCGPYTNNVNNFAADFEDAAGQTV